MKYDKKYIDFNLLGVDCLEEIMTLAKKLKITWRQVFRWKKQGFLPVKYEKKLIQLGYISKKGVHK